MADVFLSYARPTARLAQTMAEIFRAQGLSVWLDEELPAHRAYADVIANELDAARAVVVVWSQGASRSQWVRSEANRAREADKLVQLRVDAARLPMPFDQIQCADLQGWTGSQQTPAWRSIVDSVSALVSGEVATAPNASGQTEDDPSVAVLAFKDLSAARDQTYFCEGIAEEIVSVLARLPGLRVASTAASGSFENHSSREIAHILDVSSFLEGSVRKAEGRARISVRLVNTHSGFATWSETFERDLSDIFAVQDEIAVAVVRALGVSLADTDRTGMALGGSDDAAAYDLFLKARHLIRQELDDERRAAAEMLHEATRRDPGFAQAFAALAEVQAQIARLRLSGWEGAQREALAAANEAIRLAPSLAEAHLAQGEALRLKGGRGASAAYMRALALGPHDANIHYRFARFLVLEGDKAGAIRHFERAFELAPDDYRYIVFALQEYQALGDTEGEQLCLQRAAIEIERHLVLNPDDIRALGHGAGVLALLNRPAESQQAIDRALVLRPDDYSNLATLACAAVLKHDHDQALDLLERAVSTGRGDREWILADNDLAPLHGNPRFEAIIRRMK